MNFETNNNQTTPNPPVQEPVAPAYQPVQPQQPMQPQPKKDNKKLILGIVIACVVALALVFGYSKYNENVSAVEDMIDDIGVVTLDSEPAILAAEEAYNELTKDEQKRVGNIDDLERSKDEYANLLIDSFESSSTYTKLKDIFFTGSMSSYNPQISIDREQKALIIRMSIDSDVASYVENYPSLARESWSGIVSSLNTITSSCYDIIDDYRLDAVLQLYPKNSSTKLLFESKNGVTSYNIID